MQKGTTVMKSLRMASAMLFTGMTLASYGMAQQPLQQQQGNQPQKPAQKPAQKDKMQGMPGMQEHAGHPMNPRTVKPEFPRMGKFRFHGSRVHRVAGVLLHSGHALHLVFLCWFLCGLLGLVSLLLL